MTQHRVKSFFPRKPFAAAGRLVGDALGYLLTSVFPSLGLLLSLGLFAAACTLYLFAGLAGEVYEGDTRRFDESALTLVNRFASPPLTSFMRAVTYLGSNEFLVGACACAVLAFVLTRRRRAAVTLLVTMAGAALLNFTLKLLSGRERPEPFFGAPPPESYSFPSGHALLSSCFYGMIAAVVAARLEGVARRGFVWAVAFLLIALIGFSRVYLGVHYPSDVAAGYAVAFVWMVVVACAGRVRGVRLRQRADCQSD
ncbi:MAG TPA: phosphatase PAP2 family protein [Pyrinomonadaceae bacterium]|nr:phosphatase PAP2 family protein [Pyrinomonadaceae bacterium]